MDGLLEQSPDLLGANRLQENYVRVKAPFNQNWVNQLKECKLNKIDQDGIFIFEAS